MSVSSFPRPAEGTWTEHYPELGTGPVSFEDSVSPEFYEAERDAIFRRAWLNVGRVDDLPRNGSWFTKELVAARTSVLVVAGHGRRDPRLPQRLPPPGQQAGLGRHPDPGDLRRRPASSPASTTDGATGSTAAAPTCTRRTSSSTSTRTTSGSPRSTASSGPGFIFVNVAATPDQSLREYLGPMVGALEDYPFDLMTERYSFRAENNSNWKVFIDAFQEYYHVPPLHTHQLGPVHRNPEATFEGAHYQLDGPHRVVSTSGSHKHTFPDEHLYPSELLMRSGNTGPWDAPDLDRELPGVNPGGVKRWGIDNFQIFPNLELLVYERNWYLSYRFWPTSHNTHVFEADLWFVPATTARERLAREYAGDHRQGVRPPGRRHAGRHAARARVPGVRRAIH